MTPVIPKHHFKLLIAAIMGFCHVEELAFDTFHHLNNTHLGWDVEVPLVTDEPLGKVRFRAEQLYPRRFVVRSV